MDKKVKMVFILFFAAVLVLFFTAGAIWHDQPKINNIHEVRLFLPFSSSYIQFGYYPEEL